MRASNWEFKNRALIFGMIFAVAFGLYALDPVNSTAALANRMAVMLGANATLLARLLFGLATFILVIAALVRTWASSYLNASTVYASEVKTDALVADGPYRYVRNPLYFGNLLLAVGMGAMVSRAGFFVAIAAMLLFCYRLIFREESDFEVRQGGEYAQYRARVPRLVPSLVPRVPSAGRPGRWADGFRAESWCWGFAAAVGVFALTLNNAAFFGLLAGSIAAIWIISSATGKSRGARPTGSQR